MPGPLMLGAIIDSACRVWQEMCGVQGMCWVYARRDMGIRIFVWWLLVKTFSIVCYFLAQFFYRSEPGPEDPHSAASEQKEKLSLSELDLSSLTSMPDRESNV